MANDFAGMLKKRGLTVDNCGLPASDFGEILGKLFRGEIDRKQARASIENALAN